MESSVPVLHIVEPTLRSKAGHCYSFLKSLAWAMETGSHSVPATVWAGRGVDSKELEDIGVVVPYFYRRLRRVQAFFLYRKLLREPGRIFIQTAGRTDLFLLHAASRGKIRRDKVFPYFHWLRLGSRKKDFIRKMAMRPPDLTILNPVESPAVQFRSLGFDRTRQVPYPVMPHRVVSGESGFRRILYAGAARRDKGFDKVV